jgi:hypothetical protein
MIFIKETNGNVRITDDSGNTALLFNNTGVQIREIGLSTGIQILQNGYPIFSAITADVSETQVLPAAGVPFSGTTADLIDILSADFFIAETAVTVNGLVNVADEGKVSTLNSTSVALAGGATYTGTGEDVSVFASVVVASLSDVNGTLQVQFSPDNINWDSTLVYETTGAINEVHRITVTRRFMRVRYINGSTAQGFLRLQTLLGKQQTLTSSLNSVIQADADATIVRPLDFNLMVAEGLYQNRNNTIKDGINFDIDALSVPEDLWDNGGLYTGFVAAPVAAQINVAGADTGTVFYSYMATATDTNYTFASIAVAGAGNYALGHNVYRCNFMYFVASTNVFNVSVITLRETATPTNIFVTIPIGLSQSYCAAYTVPFGATAYIDRITTNLRANTAGSCDGYFYFKPATESPRYRFPHEYNNQYVYFDDIDYLISIPSLTDIVPRITFSSANNLVAKISYRLILRRS